MKNWTSEGHLTELALELRAVAEAEPKELRAIDRHLRDCRACRAREALWQGLLDALGTLRPLEPSASFDEAVMARVRVRAAPARAWAPGLLRRVRRIAVGAAAIWSAAVIGAAVWFGRQLEISVVGVPSAILRSGSQILWDLVVDIGAALHATGLTHAWDQAARAVPGPGVLSALAVMTALSGLALWTLYRVTLYQPIRMRTKAHV